jgi:diguanylate cyclase (GGDEF)-like protein
MLGTPIVCGLTATGVLVVASQVHVHPLALVFASVTIALVLVRTTLTFWENSRLLETSRREALTDSLTALANRRKLLVDLEAEIESASDSEPRTLVLFDLNGFKTYNDTFGHPAGDALLARLAGKLATAVEPCGRAYRMGGDEFCVLLPGPEPDTHPLARALWATGEGFDVTSAYGAALIPDDATTVSTALSVADERLYAHKELPAEISRGTAHEPLLRTLAEREPELRGHVADVSSLPDHRRLRRVLGDDEQPAVPRRAHAGGCDRRAPTLCGAAVRSRGGRAPLHVSPTRTSRRRPSRSAPNGEGPGESRPFAFRI